MLKSDDLRFFSMIANAKSLAAAARTLNVSASAVTQRLQGLERQLGLKLTHRNGRSMVLTDEGQVLAERGEIILGELESLQDTLSSRRGTISGALRILAPFGFGRKYVAPACAEFQAIHPDVSVDLQLTDRLGRYPEQSWDVAIHIGDLHDSALKMRTLASNRRILCAAPAYLTSRSPPKTPEDLRSHDCLVLRENDEDASLWKLTKDKQVTSIRIKPKLCSNDGGIVREWALAGHGICMRSEWDVTEYLRDGRLIHVLPDYQLPPADIVLLTGSSLETAGRVRGFIDFLSHKLTTVSWAVSAR
jgi:DNA-binding transcriptional LysR family regulator